MSHVLFQSEHLKLFRLQIGRGGQEVPDDSIEHVIIFLETPCICTIICWCYLQSTVQKPQPASVVTTAKLLSFAVIRSRKSDNFERIFRQRIYLKVTYMKD